MLHRHRNLGVYSYIIVQFLQKYGVQQCFGIYYAMGFALMLEGCMSALYHICPGNANFQFGKLLKYHTSM